MSGDLVFEKIYYRPSLRPITVSFNTKDVFVEIDTLQVEEFVITDNLHVSSYMIRIHGDKLFLFADDVVLWWPIQNEIDYFSHKATVSSIEITLQDAYLEKCFPQQPRDTVEESDIPQSLSLAISILCKDVLTKGRVDDIIRLCDTYKRF